ncbi:MAG: hypothetical protein N2423_08130, partial [Novosphingobium sp.]|nr:hypothetical protein [Novosphingobium sp.]
GLFGMVMINSGPENRLLKRLGGDAEGGYRHARRLIDAQNEWLEGLASTSSRIRPIAMIYGDTPEALIAQARRAIDKGMAG